MGIVYLFFTVSVQTTIPVGTSAVQLIDSDSNKAYTFIQNKSGGSATVYLGLSNNLTAGVTGINYASINVGSNYSDDHYNGDLWGIIDGGSSGHFAYTGVLEITK